MKAMELPINVIIIIALALIVLLSITALYFSGWLPGAQTISLESVKNTACRELSTNCNNDVNLITISNFDADADGTVDPGIGIGDCNDLGGTSEDNLYMLCKCHYNADENECRDVCMCKGLPSTSEELPPPPPGME